jgi:hypothetical protein
VIPARAAYAGCHGFEVVRDMQGTIGVLGPTYFWITMRVLDQDIEFQTSMTVFLVHVGSCITGMHDAMHCVCGTCYTSGRLQLTLAVWKPSNVRTEYLAHALHDQCMVW